MLGKSHAPKTLDEFQFIKYNQSDEYKKLNRAYRTIHGIDGKKWSDKFKQRAKSTYWQLRKQDVEITAHGVGRMLSRKNMDGTPITVEQDATISKQPANYTQTNRRKVHFYDSLAVIKNEYAEVITLIPRRNAKADWGRVK